MAKTVVAKKAVTKAPSKALVPSVPSKQNLPALSDIEEFASQPTAGLENVSGADLMIPRLTILQKLSPQLEEGHGQFIKNAKYGDFCDVGTGDVFRDELVIIPCFFARVFLEWAPRSSGRGLVGNHGTDGSLLSKCKPDEKKRMVLPNGNYIAETATYFVLNWSAGGRRSFLPLSSTQLKSSRRWMTLITSERLKNNAGIDFTPPIFYRSWVATTHDESNNDGTWKGWTFEAGQTILELDPSKALLTEARSFYEQAKLGLVKGDLESTAEDHARGEPDPNAAM
ncbi:MAG: hypothetical protein MN733_42700 [Nitrososphaera sp.]|nr:hypothetical protein [Nitrososphaera sp.]